MNTRRPTSPTTTRFLRQPPQLCRELLQEVLRRVPLHQRLLVTKHLLLRRRVDHDGRLGTLLVVRREESLREARRRRSTLLGGRLRYKWRGVRRRVVLVVVIHQRHLVIFLLQRFKLDQLRRDIVLHAPVVIGFGVDVLVGSRLLIATFSFFVSSFCTTTTRALWRSGGVV